MMASRIDAIILAGTKNCPKLAVDGREEYKQFLELGGKTLVEHVIDAALGCDEISRVYVVTDYKRLSRILEARGTFGNNRLNLVPDYGSYVENIRKTFLRDVIPCAGREEYLNGSDEIDDEGCRKEYVLRNPEAAEHEVLLLYSDMPFVQSADITRFLQTSRTGKKEPDFVVGLASQEELSLLEEEVGASLSSPGTKTELLPFERTRVRPNNLCKLKPLKVPTKVWEVVQGFYQSRGLLQESGETNSVNWEEIISAAKEYVRSRAWYEKPRVLWGLWRGKKHFMRIKKAYDALAQDSQAEVRIPKKKAFERAVRNITGMRTLANVGIVHTMIDIDNAAVYEMLRADDEALFKRIYCSERRYDPGKGSGSQGHKAPEREKIYKNQVQEEV
jgi:CTP:molybdopterin cytidylyltransferase MocA